MKIVTMPTPARKPRANRRTPALTINIQTRKVDASNRQCADLAAAIQALEQVAARRARREQSLALLLTGLRAELEAGRVAQHGPAVALISQLSWGA